MLWANDDVPRYREDADVSLSSSSRYSTCEVAMGGGGPANSGGGFSFVLLDALSVALSLCREEGVEFSRRECVLPRSFSGNEDKKPSSERGDRSERSYSLGFLRIEGLLRLCNGRIGPSPRDMPKRGR